MTTLDSLLHEDTLDRIGEQARQVDFGRALLVGLAAFFIFVGKVIGVFVNAFAWVFVAVRLGYREVRSPRADVARR